MYTAALLAVHSTLAIASVICKPYTDTYDDLTVTLGLPELSPVGTYHGLNYIDFQVALVTAAGGIVPKTPPNVAVASINQDLLSGSIGISPFGALTVAPGTTSFNLYSFYFACTDLTLQAAVSVATPCTLAVTGYYVDGRQAPEVTFAFADTSTPDPMVLAQLPLTYIGLKNVTIGVASTGIAVSATVIKIDSLSHCNYS